MSMPHTCICEICRREMSPMFLGMDLSTKPDVTAFWCTKHGPITTILADNKCPKCVEEQSSLGKSDG